MKGGSTSCWADSKITSLITEDDNNIKMFDLSPGTMIFNDLMKKRKLGDRNDYELNQIIDKLLSIVNCNSFQNVKKIVISDNNLNDTHFNLMKNKFTELLKKSSIEIIDIRNNNITDKTIEDFNNLNIKNNNNVKITILSNGDETNLTWKDSALNENANENLKKPDNISLFIPEQWINELFRLIQDKNNRKIILNDLITKMKEIKIDNNIKKEEDVFTMSNEKDVSQSAQQNKLLGIGWMGFGGNNKITSGVEIIIPKPTVFSFLDMTSSDKNNRIDNIANFISSLEDIKIVNNLQTIDKLNYFKSIKQMYAKGGKYYKNKKANKTNKKTNKKHLKTRKLRR
jgi:hypothetical protein